MPNYHLQAKTGAFKIETGNATFTHQASAQIWYQKYLDSIASLNKDSKWQDFLLPYLFLQIYIEVHLHFCLRSLCKAEISTLNEKDIKEWQRKNFGDTNVKCGIIKYGKFHSLEEIFKKNFPCFKLDGIKTVLSCFEVITSFRNKIMHGHPFILSGPSGESSLVSCLKFSEFKKQSSDCQTKIVETWNNFIDAVAEQNIKLKINGLPIQSPNSGTQNYTHLYFKDV